MGLKEFKKNKWFTIVGAVGGLYILTLTIFAVWMIFFDTNSLFIHWELNKQVQELEKQKEFLEAEIAKDRKILDQLSDPKELEKFARDKYYMKKKNEEIYLIEYEDSLKIAKANE